MKKSREEKSRLHPGIDSRIMKPISQEKGASEVKHREENEKYIKLGLTLFAVIAAGLLLCFVLYRYAVIRAGIKAALRILRPFLYGALIAYILSPLCTRLETMFGTVFGEKHPGWSRGLAILLAMLAAVVVIWFLVMLVVPQIWESLNGLVTTFPEKEAAAEAWLRRFLEDRPELFNVVEGYMDQFSAQLDQWVEKTLMPRVQNMVVGLGTHVYDLLGGLKDAILGLLISAYVLASRRRFAAQARLLLHSAASPRWADWIEREVRLADDMFNGFLVGKLIDSVIMGVLCLLGTSLMGFNSAVLISTIVGVTNIIPFFGPIIGAVPCALLLLLENPLHALYFVLFIIVLQQLDGNFIGPLILGDSTGLSGFWVMFAILFFGGLWGVPGMILGVPLFALISDIFRQVIYWGLRRRGREDMIAAYEKRFHDSDKTKPRKQRRLLRKARQLEKKAAGKKAEE